MARVKPLQVVRRDEYDALVQEVVTIGNRLRIAESALAIAIETQDEILEALGNAVDYDYDEAEDAIESEFNPPDRPGERPSLSDPEWTEHLPSEYEDPDDAFEREYAEFRADNGFEDAEDVPPDTAESVQADREQDEDDDIDVEAELAAEQAKREAAEADPGAAERKRRAELRRADREGIITEPPEGPKAYVGTEDPGAGIILADHTVPDGGVQVQAPQGPQGEPGWPGD